MSGTSDAFKGLRDHVRSPSYLARAASLAFALFYVLSAVNLPAGSGPWFLGALLTFTFAAGLYLWWADRAWLLPVYALEKQPPRPEALSMAVSALARFPGRSMVLTVKAWILVDLGMGLVALQISGGGKALALRMLLLGAVFIPVTAAWAYLALLQRSRAAIAKVADAGLTAQQLVLAMPVARPLMRRRLMIFTAVSVLAPSLLIVDASLAHQRWRLDSLVAQTGPQAQAHWLWGAGAVVAALLIVMVLMGRLLGGALAERLQAVASQARALGASSSTSDRVVIAEDELWAASAAFSGMHGQLTEAIGRLKSAGLSISSTVDQLVATSRQQRDGATAQAAALSETSATTEELARSARQISANSAEVAQIAEQTLSVAQDGKSGAEHFAGSMAKAREDNQAIADAVVRLNKRVQQIGKVVEFIDGVADKSDLLALNAELEGTKAGEVGRGFSLVAAEMRRLSESVMDSTHKIGRLIEEIRDATNAAVMATEAGVKAAHEGTGLAERAATSLSEIVQLAGKTSDAARAISLATQQQQTGTDQLAEAMAELLRATESGGEATRQIAEANTDLSTLAHELKTVVERFEVRG